MEIPKLLSKADMAKRWGVSNQVVNNRENRHADFPKPVTHVHSGRLPLYLLEDVERYEEINKIIKKRYK